jgi:hypothetical protein
MLDEDEIEIVAVFPRPIGGIDAGVSWKPNARERTLIAGGEPAIDGGPAGESFTSWRLARFGMRSSIRVPLFHEGAVVGHVEMYSYESAAFSVAGAIALEHYASPLGAVLARSNPTTPAGTEHAELDASTERPPSSVVAPWSAPVRLRDEALIEHLELLEQFGSAVAHELNNPLTTVLGYAELLESLPEAERQTAIPVIIEQAQRSGSILQELLAFSRPRPLRRERIQVNALLATELATARQGAQDRAVQLRLGVVSDVSGDAESLREALRRIIAYCQFRAQPTAELRVTTLRKDAVVEISVACGFEEEMMLESAPLEPFVPSAGAWPAASLQLVRAYRTIVAHRGRVLAREGGGGVQITIELPAFVDDTAAGEAELPPQGRVVVVANDTAIARLMSAILEAAGLTPLALPTWEAAIGSSALDAADLLIVEQGSLAPPFGGPERSGSETLPVIIVRDPALPDVEWAGQRVSFLERPFTAEELLDAVRRALAGR